MSKSLESMDIFELDIIHKNEGIHCDLKPSNIIDYDFMQIEANYILKFTLFYSYFRHRTSQRFVACLRHVYFLVSFVFVHNVYRILFCVIVFICVIDSCSK